LASIEDDFVSEVGALRHLPRTLEDRVNIPSPRAMAYGAFGLFGNAIGKSGAVIIINDNTSHAAFRVDSKALAFGDLPSH
jgi:hypothetical protein